MPWALLQGEPNWQFKSGTEPPARVIDPPSPAQAPRPATSEVTANTSTPLFKIVLRQR
jgi:hypothetical protein